MKRLVYLTAIVALVLTGTVGCSSDKATKPPEADRADDMLNLVRSAFESYDAGRFEEFTGLWSSEASGDYARFPGAVKHSFTTRMIEIDGAQARVMVSWTARWTGEGGERTGSGTTVFLLAGTPLKITGLESDSPFQPPLPTPSE